MNIGLTAITPQQRQHILQSPEFQQRMSEAIEGMKYKILDKYDYHNISKGVKFALNAISFSQSGMDIDTYSNVSMCSNLDNLDIGSCQKAMFLILNITPKDIEIELPSSNQLKDYTLLITRVSYHIEAINDILRPIADKIISELHAKFTAATKIIK